MSDDPQRPENSSPLERYLAKQKQVKAHKEAMAQGPKKGWAKATNASAPPPKATPPVESVSAPAPAVAETVATPAVRPRLVAGGMMARVLAALIDLAIVGALTWPLQSVVVGAFELFSGSLLLSTETALKFIVTYAVIFAYYGWSYVEKGASPGKLLLGLAVVDATTGEKLSYSKAFFRESIGKWISAVPLAMGFIIAFFRADHRALHDLLFDTAVVRGPSVVDLKT